jgi:hypothetical protein
MPAGLTIQRMISGGANNGTAQVPTITFHGTNVAGTVVPKVGSAQSAASGSNAGALAGVTPMQIGIVVLVIIGAGYLLHHFSFEESVRAG